MFRGVHRPFYSRRSFLIFACYGVMALIAVVWARFQGRINFLEYQPSSSSIRGLHWMSSSLLGVAFGLFLVGTTRLFEEKSSSVKHLQGEFYHLLSSLSRLEVFLLSICSASGEELFFRGALLFWLETQCGGLVGTVIAIVGSSVLFALMHIGPGKRFLSWTISSFVVGVCLAILFVVTGDLIAPIASHFIVNWLNLRHLLKTPRSSVSYAS